MPVLIVPKSKGIKDAYAIDRRTSYLGRADSCDIVIVDNSISRRHAKIVRDEGQYFLEDLGSKNGSRVHGTLVTRCKIQPGDDIFFGDVRTHFLESFSEETLADQYMREAGERGESGDTTDAPNRFRVLHDLAELWTKARDERAVLSLGLDVLSENLAWDNAYLGVFDRKKNRLADGVYQTARDDALRLVVPQSLLDKVIGESRGVLLTDSRDGGDPGNSGAQAKSILCIPMLVAGDLEGVIYADTSSREGLYTEDDRDFLCAMGAMMGAVLRSIRVQTSLRRANKELHRRIEGLDMLGSGRLMTQVREKLTTFASRPDAAVFIQGEKGSGKELAARLLHRFSHRTDKPFLTSSCATFPVELLESELFGHVKGAFARANRDRRGLFEMANGGGLFLDEIDQMPLDLQAKLLGVLETKEFSPLGSDRKVRVDVRVIAATTRDPVELVTSGAFREDLFFRLHELSVTIPPLRERAEDIPQLAMHFLNLGRTRVTTPAQGFSHAAMDKLKNYDWSGNVRQLRNVVEHALYVCEGQTLLPEHLLGMEGPEEEGITIFEDIGDTESQSTIQTAYLNHAPLQKALEGLEKSRVRQALHNHGGDKGRAAAELGIPEGDLLDKIKKHEL